MSSARSITITIWNHSPYTLTKFDAKITDGGYPTPAGMSAPSSGDTLTINVPTGGSLTVKASNSDGACTGLFLVGDSGSRVAFPVYYVHPSGNDPTVVKVVPSDNFPSCMGVNDVASLSGHDPVVNTGLYVGLPVQEWDNSGKESTAGFVTPLSDNPYKQNNARDVVNSMFQPSIRKVDAVQHWFSQADAVPYMPADFSGNQLSKVKTTSPRPLVQTMLNLWPGVVDNPSTDSPDYPLIHFLANFLVPSDTSESNPPLVMYVPCFSYQGTSDATDGPVYQLSGYQAYPLAGDSSRFNMANVQTFLQLFLGGAHFVNIQADRDFSNLDLSDPPTNTSRDLYKHFKDKFDDDGTMTGRHSCVGNSHYTNTINTSGWYYGGQMGEWADSGCGLLLSLLIAKTADNQFNTFMQLEGWPADNDWLPGQTGSIKGGVRHGQDYEAYQKSLWNISTFGASPYSEKRATTIFLAPAVWVPSIYSKTFMMPYVGAETAQGWLETDLVTVPTDTPNPPSQYD